MSTVERIAHIEDAVRDALAGANVLFQQPNADGSRVRPLVHRELLHGYLSLLRAVQRELKALNHDEGSVRRYYEVTAEQPDSIDYANDLIAKAAPRAVADLLRECIWDAIRERLPAGLNADEAARDPHLVHAVTHAGRLIKTGVAAPSRYLELLSDLSQSYADDALSRLDPTGFGSLADDALCVEIGDDGLPPELVSKIYARLKAQDSFATSRTFRPFRGDIRPGPVGEIRSLSNFYGYRLEREFLEDYFDEFDGERRMQPLLLAGIPGVGKTHLTIAYSLSMPEVVLVTGDPSYLEEPLEQLIETFSRHHYRRFVLFFDDIDPGAVDWATFRNQVDGYLPFANNVAIVIATNGEFPVSIRSRCKIFEFRPMNPEVCEEFVADYLEEHRWMSQPYPDLVSTIAADFVSTFKRGLCNELTPRSLVRYFERLEGDKERVKRLIRESLEDIVRVPSEDAFFESNQRVIRQLQRESRGGDVEPSEPRLHTYFGKKNLPGPE